MSTKHTQARLRLSSSNDTQINTDQGGESLGIAQTQSSIGEVGRGMFPAPKEAEANAKRLIECWNGCHGIANPSALRDLLGAALRIQDELKAAWESGTLPASALSSEAISALSNAINNTTHEQQA
jgi:hypothetical protein